MPRNVRTPLSSRRSRRLKLVAMVGLLLAWSLSAIGCPDEPVAKTNRVLEITEQLQPGEGWASLSAADQQELQDMAAATLADFRARWGSAGLVSKEATLLAALSDTAHPATKAFDEAFRVRFRSRLEAPDGFLASSMLPEPLRVWLAKLHLVHVGARRINVVRYDGLADVDWDGAGPIREFPMPDAEAMAAQRAYARAVEDGLLGLDRGGLTAEQERIVDRAILYARQLATGSTGFRFGGRDFETPWGVAQWSWDLMCNRSAECFGDIFESDAVFLEAVNAWFSGPLLWLDEGAAAALDGLLGASEDVTEINAFLGSLETTPVARSYATLVAMWRQRTKALPEASASCAVRTEEDQDETWRSFSAENLLYPTLTGSLDSLSTDVSAFQQQLRSRQRGFVTDIVEAMEAAGEATASTVQSVKTALDAAPPRGLAYLLNVGFSALNSAQPAAADLYRTRLESLPTIGGDADAEARLQAMWDEVRGWLNQRYDAPTRYGLNMLPLPEDLDLKPSGGAFTAADGRISLGTSGKYPAPQYYKTMIHEAHHSLAYGLGGFPEGASWEGAAVVAEVDLLEAFLRDIWADNPEELARIPYYLAGVWVGNQFVAAGSEVALGNYTRDTCQPSALEYLADTAEFWGLDESLNDTLADRVFAGLNYLQYAAEAISYRKAMEALDEALGPDVTLDPYKLLSCGIGDPAGHGPLGEVTEACLKGIGP